MLAKSKETAKKQIWLPNAVRFFPIVFFEAFLLMTVAVFAFGPWDWPVANPVELYSFLFINQLALLIGYVSGVSGRSPSSFRLPLALTELAWLGTLATLVLLVPTLIVNTGGNINVARALTDPGQAYGDTRYSVTFAAPTIVEYINMLCSPIVWPLLALTVVFWSRFSVLLRYLALVGILGGASIYLLTGTNKGLVDIMLLVPWLLVIRSKCPSVILKPKRILFFCLSIVLSLTLFVPFFAINLAGRGSGKAGTEEINLGEGAFIRAIPLGTNNAVAQVYGVGYTALASYVGQGYYGLSLAMREPFVWTYGVGHSRILTWLGEKTLGGQYDIQDATYPSRVGRDFGWDSRIKWSTLYAWLAGDVTFYGVPVVVFLFGRLLGLTWLDALGGNPVAVVLFCITCLTVFYTSANAQIFQSPDTVFVFYFYLFWWIQSSGSMEKQWRSATVSIPGVMVIGSESLNGQSGTGIVFSNLFKGWPTDALAQIHVDKSIPDPQICTQHWRMSVENVPLDRAFRRIFGRNHVSALGASFHPSWSGDLAEPDRGPAWRVRMRMLLSAWADCAPFYLDSAFVNWIKEFSPEVIFSPLGSIRQIGLVQRVSSEVNAPIVPFFNDDWPRTHFGEDVLKVIPRRLILRDLKRVMAKSAVGGAICLPMAKEYRQRYGIPFETFMNCADAPAVQPRPPAGDVVRFCYVGGLHLDRWRSLVELGGCLHELSRGGLRAELLVYAPQKDMERYGSRMSGAGAIQLMGAVRPDEVPETLVKSHVLVHVESFHRVLRQYTRLSLSTKIPQYFAAGRPVLAYGPEELASCQYVRDTGSGLVVGIQERDMLIKALSQLISQPAIRDEMGKQAWRTARIEHQSGANRERFRRMLASAAWPEKQVLN